VAQVVQPDRGNTARTVSFLKVRVSRSGAIGSPFRQVNTYPLSLVMAACPRWSEPLSTMTKTPGRVVVLRAGHDLAGEIHERIDAVGAGGGGEHLPGAHVQAGQQYEGALTPVLVLVADGPAGAGGHSGMPAAAGVDLRLGIEGQDPVTGPERLALISALVQVHDHLCPGLEVRVTG
jgi:hypothetical protein